jgi:ABC-2 type transport system permease protein
MAAGGLLIGMVARAAGDAIAKSNAFARIQASLGGHAAGAAAYLGIAFVTVSALIGLQAASQSSGTREEESHGYVENLLVRGVSRARWLSARIAISVSALVLAGFVSGLATWAGAASQNSGLSLTKVVEAGLNTVPTGIFVLGVGTLALGLAPRATSALVYSMVAWSFLVEIVGGVLRANHWLLDLSLFHHVAPAPAADPRWVANGALALIGVALAALGVWSFARRDIATA